MKVLGFTLLIVGFLAAAYATALDIRATDWILFTPAALVGLAGVVLVKREASGAAQTVEVLVGNRAVLAASLDNIVRELDAIAKDTATPAGSLRHEIDRRLRDDLRRFADARESMVHLFGLQAYADIMSDFAAGERYVNRVWSASADGYGEEARRYVKRAATRFHTARERLANSAAAADDHPLPLGD